MIKDVNGEQYVSTHSRAKAAGPANLRALREQAFQLTAARRRLDVPPELEVYLDYEAMS